MKKIFSLLLVTTLLLSMSIVSFAAEITTDNTIQNVTVTYGTNQSFVVTIPSNIVIDSEGAGEAEISASNVMIAFGKVLKVTVSGDDYVDKWELIDKNEPTNTLTYYIENPAEEKIANGDVVLDVESGEAYNKTVSDIMYFWITDTITKAGEYTDTLTFTVTVEDEAALINFTVDGTSYQAEEGMTWAQFINSKYNPDYECCDSEKKFGDGEYAGYPNRVVYHRYDDCSDESYFRVSIQDYEINEGGELEQVRITDEIIANGAYESDNP